MPHESVSIISWRVEALSRKKVIFQTFFRKFLSQRSAKREMIQLTHLVTQLNFTSSDNLSGRASSAVTQLLSFATNAEDSRSHNSLKLRTQNKSWSKFNYNQSKRILMIESIQLWSFWSVYVEWKCTVIKYSVGETTNWKPSQVSSRLPPLVSAQQKSSHPKLSSQKQQKLAHNFINTTRSLKLLAFGVLKPAENINKCFATHTVREILFST